MPVIGTAAVAAAAVGNVRLHHGHDDDAEVAPHHVILDLAPEDHE